MFNLKKFGSSILLVAFLFSPTFLKAEPEQDSISSDSIQEEMNQQLMIYDSVASTLKYKQGLFVIGDNLATIKAENGFSFLESADAIKLLHVMWNNPEDNSILGAIVPSDIEANSEDLWVVVFTYDEDGHVNDDDANDIKYDELLATMKEDIENANAERLKNGYDAMHLVGWAQTPFYDKEQHKLHWAKDLTFGPENVHSLNYNVRMLGRKGVLVLNVVASMEQLPEIKSKINAIMASTNFNAGNRYNDFNVDTDKIAEYGIASLIAGGVLAKTGLLAKLGILLAKGWKIIALAIAGVAAASKKYFKRKPKKETLKGNNEDDQNTV